MNNNELAFVKKNYMIMLAGMALVVIGYFLMAGGQAENPNDFNPEVFSFVRITVAPTLVLLGFGVVGYSVFFKDKDQNQ